MAKKKKTSYLAQYAIDALKSRYQNHPPMPPWSSLEPKEFLAANLIYERIKTMTQDDIDLLVQKYFTVVIE